MIIFPCDVLLCFSNNDLFQGIFETESYFFVDMPRFVLKLILILILSREWRIIVHLVQTIYHGRPVVLKSVRFYRAVDYE